MKNFSLILWKWSRYIASIILLIHVSSLKIEHLLIFIRRSVRPYHFQNTFFPVMMSVPECPINQVKDVLFNYPGVFHAHFYQKKHIEYTNRTGATSPDAFDISHEFGLSRQQKNSVSEIKETNTERIISFPP